MRAVEFLQWAAVVLLLTIVLVSIVAATRGVQTDRHLAQVLKEIASSTRQKLPRDRKHSKNDRQKCQATKES